jgi:alpha-2-macroglobulin
MEQKTENYWDYRNLSSSLFHKEDWKKYAGETVASWSEAVPREPDNRAAEGSTVAPLTQPGAFIIEANTAGSEQPSRVLVLLTDIAIVQKSALKKGLIFVADARTGQPLPDKAVRIYEHWSEYIQTKQKSELHVDSVTLMTNKDGVIEYARRHADRGSSVEAMVAGDRGRMAFSFFQNWSEYDRGHHWEEGPRYYAITDRPVYRPGSTVKFRVWMRELRGRKYVEPQAGADLRVTVRDAKNNQVQQMTLKCDEMGAASGEFQLGEEPPLGIWHLTLNDYQPDARRSAGALFRVEEYKKPEFEVAVKRLWPRER